MAKKKLNKQVAAFVVTGTIVVLGGGFVAAKLYQGKYRPAQLKAEGRELMLKGDYEGAYRDFARAAGGGRLATDIEFLGWMYETAMHRTSYNEAALRDSRSLLEAMLATRPGDVPTLINKLKFDLDILDAGGIEQFSPDQAKRMRDQAATVLAAQPDNSVALRADSMALSLPIIKADTTTTSGDIDAILTELRTRLDKRPDDADLFTLYALGTSRLHEVLLREHAIDASPDNPRTKAMHDDLEARLQTLLTSLDDKSKPADVRAMGYTRAARIDQIIGSSGFVSGNEALMKLVERRAKSTAAAAQLVPPTSEYYVPFRLEQAASLAQTEKFPEAEAMLKETIANAPNSWQPRLFLADLYSERGRGADAMALVSVDLKPDASLVGLAGYQFNFDRRQIPLRRAFYRLQNLPSTKPEDRDKEIATAKADYDLALADGKIPASDAYALQIQAALQELKLDRTGAVQTLTRALEAAPNDRMKLRLQQQLVSLNLALNQPGAASAMLKEMLQNPTLTPMTRVSSVIQLIDLRIRNGQTEEARLLLNTAKQWLGDNPALTALEIRMMSDPAQRKAALAKIPEDTPTAQRVKMKFAAEVGDDATVTRLATDALKKEPGSVEVSMLYGDYLRRHEKRDEAVAVFKAALDAHPDNKTLQLLIDDTKAVSTEERQKLVESMITDPYKRALYDADQLRAANKFDEYEKKLLEAEPLDTAKDGVATERLAFLYLATGDRAKASAAVDRLSKLERDPAQIRVLRVRLAMLNSQLNDASSQADALTSELPNYSPGWIVKGQVQLQNNQPNQAIDSFETALTQQPESVEALHGLVEAADRAGRKDVLKRYIELGSRIAKNDDFFKDWALRYELAFGDPTTTVDERLKRRDANPDDGNTWIALAQAYLSSAQYKLRAGDTTAAEDYRKKALEVFQQAAVKFPKASGFTLQAADLIAKSGAVDRALAMVDAMDADKAALTPETQAIRARFYADHNQPDKAVKLLQEQVDAGKANDDMRMQLTVLLAGAGKTDAALKAMDGITDTPQAREARMNILVAGNRLPEAQKFVDAALAKERSVPNLLMAALVRSDARPNTEAMKLVDEAVTLDPESAPAHYTRARLALAEKPLRNNDIINDLLVVKKNMPGNIDARLLLVDRLRALSRGPEATQELEAIQRDFPGDRRVMTQLVQAYANEVPPRFARIDQLLAEVKRYGGAADPDMLSLEASISLLRGDNAHAIEAARAASKAAPQNVALVRRLLEVMLKANAFNDAIAEADRIQKDNSSLYWTYMTRGQALHGLKREDEAAKEFDRAIGLALALKSSQQGAFEVASTYAHEYGADTAADWIKSKMPDGTESRVLQMQLLTNGGKTDKAIAVGEQLLAKLEELPVPARIQLLSTMGNAYLTASPPRADNARVVFARLNELEPDNMMTLNNLAYAMTLGGTGPSMQDAVGYAARANELSRKNASPNPYIMDTYGWTLVQSGKVDEGLGVLREAFEAGSLPETEYHIGEVYILQNQKEAALQTLKSAQQKVKAAQQAGQATDGTLPAHIDDAIKRAEALATP